MGVGVGGTAVAGHAALLGHEVSVLDVRRDAVDAIAARGGIRVTGKEEGFAPVTVATTEPAEAIPGAELVAIVTQGPHQAAAAESFVAHLGSGTLVLVMPGGTGGALEVRRTLREDGTGAGTGASAGFPVAETDAFPYGCSIPEPGVSSIGSVKRSFRVAAVPSEATGNAVDVVRALFPQAQPATSVLETSLGNLNAILHLAPMVTNAGRIEHEGGAFDYYGDGVTPSVARLMQRTDAERVAVGRALGLALPTLLDWISETYGVVETEVSAAVGRLSREVYGPMPAPTSLEHRYLSEDVPCGAVPIASLGRQLGVDVAVTDRCVELASALTGRDFRAEGRSSERLGLAGLSASEIVARLSPPSVSARGGDA